VPLLSHHALAVARHSLDLTGTEAAARFTLGERVAHVRRRDGHGYWLADARLARPFARTTVFLDGTNLLDTRYQEIVGVDMPGRQFRVGLTVRP
jgi:outer membrane receptor protein involved in Fe transport